MKHRTWPALVCMLLLVAVLAGCGGNKEQPASSKSEPAVKPATTLKVTVANATDYMFNELYVSPTAQNEWGDDHLGSTSVLKKNGSVDITLPAYDYDSYDIRVVDEDDDVYVFQRVSLKNGSTVSIFWEDGPIAQVEDADGEIAQVAGVME